MPLGWPDVLFGILLPALGTALALLIGWRPWRRGRIRDGRWIGALAVGGGFVGALGRFIAFDSFPPSDPEAWVAWLMLPLAALGALDAWVKPPLRLRIPVVLAIFALLVWLLVRPRIGLNMPAGTAWAWVAVWAVVLTLSWVSLEALADRAEGRALSGVFLLLACGTAGVLVCVSIVHAALAAGAIAALAVAASVVGWWAGGRFSLARGATLAFLVALGGLAVYGFFYMDSDPTPRLTAAYALLLASPSLAWAADLPGPRRLHPPARLLIRLAAVLLGIAGAFALAFDRATFPTGA